MTTKTYDDKDIPFVKDGFYGSAHAQQEFCACQERGIRFAAHGNKWLYNINGTGWVYNTTTQTAERQANDAALPRGY